MTTVREARAAFFARSGFDESSYTDAWVLLRFGPIPFAFPNTASRKRAVPLHDIHHALTGYDTTWRGETSQSAWEIGSGCGNYGAAWAINFGGLALGLVMYPRETMKALMRGRRSGNLYRDHDWPRVLDEDLEFVRGRLAIDAIGA